MIQTIVVPIDPDDENSWRAALPRAIDYAQHLGASLHALTVVPNNLVRMTVVAQLIPDGFEEKLVTEAKKHLASLLEGRMPEGVEVVQAVRHGSVHHEILRYCRDVEADLVIMAARKPGLTDYLLGPTPAHVVRHADCSVWVVRE